MSIVTIPGRHQARSRTRLRAFSWQNIREDWLLWRAGVLDLASLISGYMPHYNSASLSVTRLVEHGEVLPAWMLVRNEDGSVLRDWEHGNKRRAWKAIRRRHNLRTNNGTDWVAAMVGGSSGTATLFDSDSGTSTATGATTLTDSGKAWTVNAWAGHVVTTGLRYGVVLSNTATVLTVDRWNDPTNNAGTPSNSTPGGTAASTPGTGNYVIQRGQAPAPWMGITANATAPGASDTTLTAELTGTLARKYATMQVRSAAQASLEMKATWTYDGATPAGPIVAAKLGMFTAQNGGTMAFETLLSSTATVNANGDQVIGDWTDTI